MKSQPPAGEETQLQRSIAWQAAGPGLAILTWRDLAGEHTARLEERTTVGSAHGNGLVVVDPAVSRLHAELELRENGVWVRDVGSRNGTFVNGIQVQAAHVPDGGHIKIGSTEFHVNYVALKREVALWPEGRFGPLIGTAPAMRSLFASLARIAPLDSSVLVYGETGTGKELVARAIHEASSRASGPFVVVDCGALPDNLLDSELFGHAKGAFTGAVGGRIGSIEAADGGTVFLDEIGELPLQMQPKLLRVLESRTVRRIGETQHRKVNVRFISATHRDLLTMVNAGEFREDLYFRLAVLPVVTPPLRDRTEDVGPLIMHFHPEARGAVTPELLRELSSRPWRGNVRELRNFVERVLALGPTQALAMAHEDTRARPPPPSGAMPAAMLTASADGPASQDGAGASEATTSLPQLDINFRQGFKDFREKWIDLGEREYLLRLLERHGRNVATAAEEAAVDRTYMYRLIRKHGM